MVVEMPVVAQGAVDVVAEVPPFQGNSQGRQLVDCNLDTRISHQLDRNPPRDADRKVDKKISSHRGIFNEAALTIRPGQEHNLGVDRMP